MNIDYSILTNAINLIGQFSYQDRIVKGANMAKAAIGAGQIWKPDFDSVKYNLERSLENMAYTVIYTTYREQLAQNQWKEVSDKNLNFRTAAKIDAEYKKSGIYTKYPDIKTLIACWIEGAKIMEALKGILQKGRQPKTPSATANTFNKPMPKSESIKEVNLILSALTASVRTQYIDSFVKMFTKYVSDLDKKGYTGNEVFKSGSPTDKDIAKDFFTLTSSKTETMKPKSGVEVLIKDKAQRVADDILQQFIVKNIQKMALVFEKKPGVKESKVVKKNVSGSAFEALIYVEFTDGSSFYLDTKTEFGYSKYGKMFVKYPSRFTNVTFNTGVKMKGPSEEKMIKEF